MYMKRSALQTVVCVCWRVYMHFSYNDFVSLSHHTEGKEANSKSEEEEKVYHPMI